MRTILVSNHPCQRQHVDGSGAASKQDRGACAECRPGREHVVDQDDAPSRQPVAMAPVHLERGGGDVLPARLLAEALLRCRLAVADEEVGDQARAAASADDRLGEQCRLIVAAAQKTQAMQRDRRDQIRPRQHLVAGPHHPLAERRGGIDAVGVLEREDQLSRAVVVA